MLETILLLTVDARQRTTDLVILTAVLVAAVAAVLLDAPVVVRVPLALVTVLALPGYALTVALFPADGRAQSRKSTADVEADGRGLDRLERGVLSVGFSLALVPLVLLALDTLGGQLTTESVLFTVAGVTVVTTGVAAVRRRATPSAIRYMPTLAPAPNATGGRFRLDTLTVALALCVLFAGGAIAYPATVTDQSSVTEFYLLSPTDEGELRSADYPTEFTAGVGEPLSVGIGNLEGETTNYTVVTQLQRAERRDNTTVVRGRRPLEQAQVTVPANGTRILNQTVTVDSPGEYRLVYLLYRGDAPANPQVANSYREVHLWIDVSAPDPDT